MVHSLDLCLSTSSVFLEIMLRNGSFYDGKIIIRNSRLCSSFKKIRILRIRSAANPRKKKIKSNEKTWKKKNINELNHPVLVLSRDHLQNGCSLTVSTKILSSLTRTLRFDEKKSAEVLSQNQRAPYDNVCPFLMLRKKYLQLL